VKPVLVLRVAARYQRKMADQPPGQKQRARKITSPINRPKGIGKGITKDYGESSDTGLEAAPAHRRDIEPEDVFNPLPKDVAVRNFAETGKDLSKAIHTQIPKDKGYETVKNLSQYLITTQGGGEGGPKSPRGVNP